MLFPTDFSALPWVLKIDNPFATVHISLFGGQILSYVPKSDGIERLWLSPNAIFDQKKPIRGGIPICWPWFGPNSIDKNAPNHGYVRNQRWQVTRQEESESGSLIELSPLSSNNESYAINAQLTLVIIIGNSLSISLETHNLGNQPIRFTAALHSYFKVSRIDKVNIKGLNGDYIDKTDNSAIKSTPDPYQISQETDRIHLTEQPQLIIDDKNPTQITSIGHDSVVIWNPWQEKAQELKDMPNDGYQDMLCAETAITQNPQLASGQTHTLTQIISPN